MDVVDILISIVVVTILVTIILAVVTYVAYKLRLAREPAREEDDPKALRYFVRFEPPSSRGPEQPVVDRAGTSAESEATEHVAGLAGSG